MFITTFQRKMVRGKMQWVCEKSTEQSDSTIDWWIGQGNFLLTYPCIRRVSAITPMRVPLGSCKRPHHYIWSKTC
jgi:hypothetical protein